MEFTLSHDVAAPPEHVFSVMTDLDGFDKWMPGFVRVERLTDGPLAVGSQFNETRMVFKRESTEHFECISYDAPREFELFVDGTKGTTGKGEFRFLHRVEPQGDGTRITISGSVTGMGKMATFFGFLFKPMMRKALVKDFQALGAYAESTAP